MSFSNFFKQLCVAAALSSAVLASHAACVNSPSDTTSTFPSTLTGKVLWHSYTAYGDGSSQIFVRNIAAGSTTQISGGTGWTGISDPMNGVFNNDGTYIVFMAIKNTAWNIFAVPAGGGTPTNLTNSTGTTRNEDPKLSNDGTKVIWKQKQGTTYRIMSAPISFSGTPALGTTTTMKTGTVENSMPFVDSAFSKLYYSPGTGSFTVASQALASGVTTGSATTISTNGYYPIVRWSDDTVFWADRTTQGSNDQIAYKAGGTGTTTIPSINDCNGNNSDPWPVASSTYVFFSSTTPGGYQLYLGDVSSGTRWNMSSWYTDTAKAHLGAAYYGGGGGSGGGGSCPASGTSTNLSAGKLATASSSYNGTTLAPSKAVDGNTSSTRWDSLEPMPLPTWFMVDLGALKHVDGIDLYWDAAAKNYTVDISQDGTTWTNLVTQATAGASFTHKAFPGLSGCGRYVRVNGTTADTAWGMALWEMQVWGY